MKLEISSCNLAIAFVGALFLAACGAPAPGDTSDEVLAVRTSEGPQASDGRPAAVPEDFVVTPNGYFHPSCVRALADGEKLLHDDRKIVRADGSTRDIEPCAYPHYNQRGEVIAPTGEKAPPPWTPWTGDRWVEGGQDSSWGALQFMYAQWSVPRAPSVQSSQVVYLFPGLENTALQDRIIQPVLGWNGNVAGKWSIASWNCCISGTTWFSNPVTVSPGDNIIGIMSGTDCGEEICDSWTITTQDTTTNQATNLVTSTGESENWSFGGVLEIWNLASCSELPNNSGAIFNHIAIEPTEEGEVNVDYTTFVDTSDSPQCSYGATAGTGGVGLADVEVFWSP